MKTLNSHIKEQEQFVLKEKFVLEILKFHKNRLDNPFHKIEKFKVNRKNDLLCVISHKLQQKYELEKYINNYDYFWECLDEFAYDIQDGFCDEEGKKWQYIGLKNIGIFSYFDIVPKKNRINISDATQFFIDRIDFIN